MTTCGAKRKSHECDVLSRYCDIRSRVLFACMRFSSQANDLTAFTSQILAAMVSSKEVRAALRELRGKISPDDFADEAGVNRATVYRIEDLKRSYTPRIETIDALVRSRGLTLSAFFAQLEGLHAQPDDGRASSARPLTRGADPSVSRPLDDTGALVAGLSSAVVTLARSIDRLGERAGAPREQTAGTRDHAARRPLRGRKTG